MTDEPGHTRWQGAVNDPDHPDYHDIHAREHRHEAVPSLDQATRLVVDSAAEQNLMRSLDESENARPPRAEGGDVAETPS